MKIYLHAYLALSLLAIACGPANPAPEKAAQTTPEQSAPVPPPRKIILFFGNSLTAAYQLPPEQGFAAVIQKKIDSLGLPYLCVNAGLSGETTADGKNRIDWVLRQPVSVLVLELGANDALRGQPVEEAKKNLQTIIDRTKAGYPDCKIVLAGMQAPPNLGPAYTRAFREMYPALARQNKAALIPFLLENVAGESSLNLEDGIHPNAEGHKIVAETVWKVLRPLLETEK